MGRLGGAVQSGLTAGQGGGLEVLELLGLLG